MKKLFPVIKELLIIACTILVAFSLFLFTYAYFANKYYDAIRSVLVSDYFRFKSDFGSNYIVWFLTLRLILPLLGILYLTKKITGWLSRGSGIRQKIKASGIYLRLFHLFVILIALLAIERFLQKSGRFNGYNYKTFRYMGKLEDLSFQYSDSLGIIRANPHSGHVPWFYDYVNRDGFRSKYEFDSASVHSLKASGEKLLMFIGDSYTEGASAYPRNQCFVDLIDKNPAYTSFNFGMDATDPLQYKLVARHYVTAVKPDAVVIVCYDNDVMQYDRIPAPHVPLYYLTNVADNELWQAQKPIEWGYQPNDILRTKEEAFSFYKDYCFRSRNTFMGKVCARSVFTTHLYYKFCDVDTTLEKYELNYNLPYAYNNLKQIQNLCDSLSVPVLFFFIPHLKNLSKPQQEMAAKYAQAFKDLPIHYFHDLTIADHLSSTGDTHFNNEGHAKYAGYVTAVLDSVFAMSEAAN